MKPHELFLVELDEGTGHCRVVCLECYINEHVPNDALFAYMQSHTHGIPTCVPYTEPKLPVFNSNGTLNLKNPLVVKELQELGWTGCDHFDCACSDRDRAREDKVIKAFYKKHKYDK